MRAFFQWRVRWWGLLMAAGGVATLASLLGCAGCWCWACDLFAHFRPQYLLALAPLTLLCAARRRWRVTALFGAAAILNGALIGPLYVTPPDDGTPRGPALRALLINVHTRSTAYQRVEEAIRAAAPDIVLLEEVDQRWLDQLRALTNDYPHTLAAPRDDNFGIALFSRRPLHAPRVIEIGDAEVPSLLVEIETDTGRFTLIGTHPLPPANGAYTRYRDGQLTALAQRVRQTHAPLLVLGDLNVSPWSWPFRRLVRESGLCDSARGFGLQPSWPTYNPLLWVPIDHCLHTPDIRILARCIGPAIGSDHYPLIVDFALPQEP